MHNGSSYKPSTPSIPDHELIRRIGQGSYGEVWLARSATDALRAVKVVRRDSFSDGRPFEREFAGLKRFEPISRGHPGFVSVLHVGRNETAGYFYCIMELADDAASGLAIQPANYQPRTLASELATRKRLPLDECVEVGLSLAGALKELHRRGLVHRDLKPSNIIFVNGDPKLADIGLVTTICEAATSLGTRGYAPPEDPGHPTADLYSLGKILYQISTGKSPDCFPEPPTELRDLGDDGAFLRFNEIILRACESIPQKRYQSAEAMRTALSRCRQILSSLPSSAAETAPTRTKGATDCERKLLTVLLINFTRTDRVDPERAQSFMKSCVELVRPILERFGGTPAQALSDGLLAVFGAPIACEDHARRATHAALAIRQTFESQRQKLEAAHGLKFELRLTLNTDLGISGQTSRDPPPSGDLVDLAMRVAHFTEPDQVAITEATCKVVQDYFVLHSLGERRLPGRTTPLRLYGVTAIRELRTRLEACSERGLTPFVGRGKELALLRERLDDARMGRGQIVLLAGEPGVGKSRLLLEFQRSLGGEPVTWLAGRSISFGQQMAYLPILDLLKRWFQIEENDDPQTICARIETVGQKLRPEALPALPLLRHLLSVPAPEDAAPSLSAEERRIKTFEALRDLVLKQAQSGPVALVVEDLHWVDRTSEEFLVWLADSLTMAPVMMLLTYRPEYRNRFSEQSFVTHLRLRQLTDQESLEMASQVLTVSQLPDQLRDLVLARAEGNPFFVEEMLKSMLEAGALVPRPGDAAPFDATSWAQVPDTIQDVILSRIGRLEESSRRALQLASVIGREFAVPLLETIADLGEPLLDSLRKLKSLELIYERSVFPEHTCFFKHALTQEVAYNSLLLQRRKELHCLVAAAIEELYAGRLTDFYSLLAYHYQRGEEWERALEYLQRAAERCRAIGANREEALQLSRAIAIAQNLGQAGAVTDLRGQRGAAWVKCGLWAKAKPDLERALVGLPADNHGRRAELLCSLAGACFWALDVSGTQRYGAEGHGEALQAGRQDLIAESLTYLGAGQQALGNLIPAMEFFERARAMGAGCFSAALANYPLTLYLNGRLKDALLHAQEAAEKFRRLSDAFASTFGHPHLGLALASRGRYAEAARVFEEARQLGTKFEIWPFHARAVAMSAGFHLDVFDLGGHEALATEARERARSAGFRPSEVSATIDLAFNCVRRGEVTRSESLAQEAEILSEQIGGWHQWLWNLRIKQARAELAVARGQATSAIDFATEAVTGSRTHGRIKYVVVGLETRASALATVGRTREATADLRDAVELARGMGDPALFLRAATRLLAIDGNDQLLEETRTTAAGIVAQLPNAEMQRQFQAAQAVRRLGALPTGTG